jgi:hypothetical protein
MGYKVLGYGVWQGVKWYVRGKTPGASRKPSVRTIAIAGATGGALIAGAVLAQKQLAGD